MKLKITTILLFATYYYSYAQDNVIYPPNTVINAVTDLGMVNDGVYDNTVKLETAIRSLMGDFSDTSNGFTLYFPNGTYLISNGVSTGQYLPTGLAKNIHIQGQSRNGTIIRLKDNATGFSNPSIKKTMIAFYEGEAYNNNAFNNTIEDITINTGRNNPGAVGVEFISNNCGAIRNVTIKSEDYQGVHGLMMLANLNGMTMLRNVRVDGFQSGIYTQFHHSCIVMDSITLTNQKQYGIHNNDKPLQISNLLSINNCPAIYSTGSKAHLTILNSTLNKTQNLSDTAIIMDGGFLFARDITQNGYQSILFTPSGLNSAKNVTEFVSHLNVDKAWKLWDNAADQSLKMDLATPKEMLWSDISKIYVVPAPDASGNHTALIRNAFNDAVAKGKTHVIFQKAEYSVTDTIVVPAQIERITGNWAVISIKTPLRYSNKAVFIFRNSIYKTKLIEKFVTPFSYLTTNPSMSSYFIANSMDSTLTVRDLNINFAVYKGTGKGLVYLENVNALGNSPTGTKLAKAGFYAANGHKVKARQLDLEQFSPNLHCDSCELLISGFKVGEKSGLHFNIQNATAEVLGGVVNATESTSLNDTTTIFRIINSNTSIVCHERTSTDINFNPVVIEETNQGITRKLLHGNVLKRSTENAAVLPLFTSLKQNNISNLEQNINAQISIYPNPATNYISVSTPLSATFNYEFYTLQGQMKVEGYSQDIISTTELESGMYILRINTNVGSHYEKVMIKR